MTTSADQPRANADEGSDGGAGETAFAFDRETAVDRVGPGRWRTMIHRHWNINTNPNGGYAMTPLLRAMADTLGVAEGSGHRDPISLTTHFLRPAVAGSEAELTVEVLRSGRRTSTVRGSMVQDGRPRLETVATFADLGDGAESGSSLRIEPPTMPPPDGCPSRVELTEGVELPLLSRVEVRIDPRHSELTASGQAVTAGWVRLLDGRRPDTLAVAMMVDCFPPSIFGLSGRTGWVPTIELTVHVRRRPVDGWLRGRFETRELAGSTVIEDGILWDAADRVVAQARQLAMVTD